MTSEREILPLGSLAFDEAPADTSILCWSEVPPAVGYEVRLVGPSGETHYSVAEPALLVELVAGQRYSVWIDAYSAYGTRLARLGVGVSARD